jgi:hypothetical protein
MYLIYLFIIVLFIAILREFTKVFNLKIISDNNYYNLSTFVEPITRGFNMFKYQEFNEKYKVG